VASDSSLRHEIAEPNAVTHGKTMEFAAIALPNLHFAKMSNKDAWFGRMSATKSTRPEKF